jgi:N-acetylglucosaminyldiphosphoundecaprenol N-acetyl-beta-D-mannosaminyltransferase
MIKTKISLQTKTQSFTHYDAIKHQYRGNIIDKPIALILILILLPCFLLNITLAITTRRNLFSKKYKTDALSRKVTLHRFSCGLWVKTAVLFDICLGKISFCGIPLTHRLSPDMQFYVLNQIKCKTGIFSLYDLHLKTGITVMTPEQLLEQQLNGNLANYLALMSKVLSRLLFMAKKLKDLKNLSTYLCLV